jgi:hypothetical protein
MATIAPRALVLLGAASVLAACSRGRVTPVPAQLIQADCPLDATEPAARARHDSSSRFKAARTVETKYITTIIDGYVAEWNATGNRGEYNGPPIAQKDVEHVGVQFGPYAERRYGVCPGVAALLIDTKSGSWRPYAARESR